MIKYDTSANVVSLYNPILALHPSIRKLVNQDFIKPILNKFFEKRGGINSFEALDNDRLTTEIEFNNTNTDESYVKNYIYKDIVNWIEKDSNGKLHYKPRYATSFDRDLTDFSPDPNHNKYSPVNYPYRKIFNDNTKEEKEIRYGTIRLGNVPLLYIIFIDIQEIIEYIKKNRITTKSFSLGKINTETHEETKMRLYDDLIRTNEINIAASNSSSHKERLIQEIQRLRLLREEKLQGESGEFRVNLAWQTTDDLDLHIETPSGTIQYDNKIIEYRGIIGELDVDQNAGTILVSNPQENIKWNSIPVGKHIIYVQLYNSHESTKVQFTITIISNSGEGMIFNSFVDIAENKKRLIGSFEFNNGEMFFDSFL